MAQLPQEQKAKIAEQVASFQEEKSKLDAEVSKWDDSGNDIIVLAKQMCMIMMEMTDFTRWVFFICAHTIFSQNWLGCWSFNEIFCKYSEECYFLWFPLNVTLLKPVY